jgi:cytochrome b6-f complex iron-sulfur subunit
MQKTIRPIERRQFFKQAGKWFGCSAAMVFLKACNSNDVSPSVPFSIDLTTSAYSALQKVGGSVVVNRVIIIRKSTSDYIALSTICTHQSCTVNYNSSTTELVCPCHGSVFNNSGQVLLGPASSPLPTYTVSISGNVLKVG